MCRVSFGKVAEFQKRGSVHFHAVMRLDGPDGPDTAPPAWAAVPLLDASIRAAAARVSVPVPASGDHPARVLRWGSQVDVQPIGALGHEELTEQAVASYVAKYATKAAETTGTVDRRIGELSELDKLPLPAHTRRLIEACWNLDDVTSDREYARFYASKFPRGDLYVVEPVGALEPSAEDHFPSWTVPAARVRSVYDRYVRLTDKQHRSLLRRWTAADLEHAHARE